MSAVGSTSAYPSASAATKAVWTSAAGIERPPNSSGMVAQASCASVVSKPRSTAARTVASTHIDVIIPQTTRLVDARVAQMRLERRLEEAVRVGLLDTASPAAGRTVSWISTPVVPGAMKAASGASHTCWMCTIGSPEARNASSSSRACAAACSGPSSGLRAAGEVVVLDVDDHKCSGHADLPERPRLPEPVLHRYSAERLGIDVDHRRRAAPGAGRGRGRAARPRRTAAAAVRPLGLDQHVAAAAVAQPLERRRAEHDVARERRLAAAARWRRRRRSATPADAAAASTRTRRRNGG